MPDPIKRSQAMAEQLPPAIKGRGTPLNPANRFEKLEIEIDPDWLENAEDTRVRTEYFVDRSRQILARNDSPDLSFTYSLNPYRGCEHGCVYCYARPTHEYFGLSSGLDFETKIMIKTEAPRLLEKVFRSPSWQPQLVCLSGNTDCYQLVEKRLQLTRRCLEVFLKYRNPVAVITKNALILRDLDLLHQLALDNLVRVTISVTTLDNTLTRKMEPRTSAPPRRLEAIERLAAAGIPVSVNVAPVIPGLNDHEIPAILRDAACRGATGADMIMLRLPHAVKELFVAWLRQHYPQRAERVLHAVQEVRAGRLNDPCFSTRLTGEGVRAESILRLFQMSCEKYGLSQQPPTLSTDKFRGLGGRQGELFTVSV